MPRKLTISDGAKFGQLTVLHELTEHARNGARRWLCRCDCGRTKAFIGSNLVARNTVSCGCWNRRRASTLNLKHGASGTLEYWIWGSMRQRCENPSDPSYPDYGGRGIRVCDAWHDFAVFIRDIGHRPSDSHSLDRIDNDGPYDAANCRWATAETQARNKRTNLRFTLGGVTMIAADWAAVTGLDRRTLAKRRKRGWSDEAVLTRPLRRRME